MSVLRNEGAEYALAYAIISMGEADKVLDRVRPEAFTDGTIADIARASQRLIDERSPVDLVSLSGKMGSLGYGNPGSLLADVEDRADVASGLNWRSAAKIVEQAYIRRSIIEAATSMAEQANDGEADIEDIMQKAEEAIYLLKRSGTIDSVITMPEAVQQVLDSYEKAQKLNDDGVGITGIDTGFKDLNYLTLGWQPSDFCVIAARPSIGKSALAGETAVQAAKLGYNPLVFSLEMSARQYVGRLIPPRAGVDANRAMLGRMNDNEWDEVTKVAGRIAGYDMYIDDSAGRTIYDMQSITRKMHEKAGVGLVIIDYLQLMEGAQGHNREREVAKISRGLKKLAKDLDIPVIALSQLNRQVEQQPGGEPGLHNLRESGAIEQDCDVACFLWNAENYTPENRVVNVGVKKNRNVGRLGKTQLVYLPNSAKLEQYERGY